MQEQVGNYRIVGVLGAGGMGTVYRAEHVLIGQAVAIKVLAPELATDRTTVTRFLNEARAASAIEHPGIIEVFDVGQLADGSAYIAMELLQGESLSDRLLARGRLAEAEAFAIVRGIAGALAAAHAAGVVHRDIKPDNIFLVPDDAAVGGERVKVLDFGIAKMTGPRTEVGVTVAGMVLGTPRYMAPEQCRGVGSVDHRADLYSLGCVLFELLSGRWLFDGSVEDMLAAQQHCEPPLLRACVPSASARAEELVSALLAKRRDDRMPSARALLDAIDGHAWRGAVEPQARAATVLDCPDPLAAQPTTLSLALPRSPTTVRARRVGWLATPRALVALVLAGAVAIGCVLAVAQRSTRAGGEVSSVPAGDVPDSVGPSAAAAPTTTAEARPTKVDIPSTPAASGAASPTATFAVPAPDGAPPSASVVTRGAAAGRSSTPATNRVRDWPRDVARSAAGEHGRRPDRPRREMPRRARPAAAAAVPLGPRTTDEPAHETPRSNLPLATKL